jgi:hypothetical protein
MQKKSVGSPMVRRKGEGSSLGQKVKATESISVPQVEIYEEEKE